MQSIDKKQILLIISGGIAAYKSLELIRRLKERGAQVRCILTGGGAEFITPLSVAALSGEKVYSDLFSLKDESEMGHIRLSREADLVVVAPASANMLAKMTQGLASDLATTALLATDKPVMVAPAMNVQMWENDATQANMALLEKRGILRVGPNAGDMACGETGAGRMAEPGEILTAIEDFFAYGDLLKGMKALVTSGPTHEPIDPVRFIGNYSSGKQGHAIATALARAGADTTLVSGPVGIADPAGVDVIHVQTAREMLDACEGALPVDIAVCAAAVADWRAKSAADSKIKKDRDSAPPNLELVENPDILATLSKPGNKRPGLVVGFAAETGDVVAKAKTKLKSKGCDWIIANDVSPETGTFGGDDNTVNLIRCDEAASWPRMSKQAVAKQLVHEIAIHHNRIQD